MKAMEETILIEGHKVKIRYAGQNNPNALQSMRELMEQQEIVPKITKKIDKNGQK